MRILTLSTIYPNEYVKNQGRSVAFLDEALARSEVQGTTLVLRPWVPSWISKKVSKWRHLAEPPRVEKKEGLTVVFDRYLHIPHRYRLDLSARFMVRQARKWTRKLGVSFDLVHGQSIFPAAWAACELAGENGVPFMITLRDELSHLEDLVKNNAGLQRGFQKMFQQVGAILVHGPGILGEIPSYLPPERNIPVLLAPNGVDAEGIERIFSALPPPPPRPWGHIVSASFLSRFKGIHENLLALKILDEEGLQDWRYTIVGDGPYRNELRDLSLHLGLKERIRFVGQVSYEEAIGRIRDADIFSLPSFREPFGNVYAEAAVCGKPVIGCRGQGAEVTVRDGETGVLVPPRDVRTLAEALAYLLRHPEKAREMGEKGRENIRQFTWEKTAAIYKGVMEKVAGKASARQPLPHRELHP